MDLPNGLRNFRKEFKLTQKQIANSINVAESLYQRYEYGKVDPSSNVLMKIAEHFDVSLDYLVGRTDNPNSHKL